jgi:hypothetical protein
MRKLLLQVIYCAAAHTLPVSGNSAHTRNGLLDLLNKFDLTGEIHSSLPLLSSALELEGKHLQTSSGSSGGSGNGSPGPVVESLRRRGGHSPCECPEEWDIGSDDCVQRRYNLIGFAYNDVFPVQGNVSQLRSTFATLDEKVGKVSAQVDTLYGRLLAGNGTKLSFADQTNQQVSLMKRVTDALTTCVSSIWVQHFGVTEKLEREMDRLDSMVSNATERILDWFSSLQQREEALTYRNQLRLVQGASGVVTSAVSRMNKYISKSWNALSQLDSALGGSSAGTDELARALNSGADGLERRLESFTDSFQSIASDWKTKVESEVQSQRMSTLNLFANKLISSLNAISSKKISQVREQSMAQAKEQSDSMVKNLLPRIRKDTDAAMGRVGNSADNYLQAMNDLKIHLQDVIESVFRNRSDDVNNFTRMDRQTLSGINQVLQLGNADVEKFNNERGQLVASLNQKLKYLTIKAQTDFRNMLLSITDSQSKSIFTSASSITTDALSKLDALHMNNVYSLRRAIADHSGDFATQAHRSISETQRVSGGIRLGYLQGDSALSAAFSRISNDGNSLTSNLVSLLDREIGNKIGQLRPLNARAAEEALHAFRSDGLNNVRLYSSNTARDQDIAATKTSNQIDDFLQSLSKSADLVKGTQDDIRALLNDATVAGNSQLRDPQRLDMLLRNSVGDAAQNLADHEEGAQNALLNFANSIPLSMQDQIRRASNGNQHYIGDPLTGTADQLGEIRGQLDDSVNQQSRSVGFGVDSMNEANSRIKTLTNQFDSISSDRVGHIDATMQGAQAPLYQTAASVLAPSSRIADMNMNKINQLGLIGRSSIDRISLDAMERGRNEIGRHRYFASLLKRFVDGTSPQLAKAAGEIVAQRIKAGEFFTRARQDVGRAIREGRGNTTELWEIALSDLKDRISRHNTTSLDLLNLISGSIIRQMDQTPANVSTSIARFVDAFMNQENLLEIQLRNVSKTAINVTAVSNQNLTKTRLNSTYDTSNSYRLLQTLMNQSVHVLGNSALVAQAPAPVPFSLISRTLQGRARAAQAAKQITDLTIGQINDMLNAAVQTANVSVQNASVETFRAGIHAKLDAQLSANKMASTDAFLRQFYGDTDNVVQDYRDEIEAYERNNTMTSESLYDQLIQVKSAALNSMGQIAERVAKNREFSDSNQAANPKITTGLIRQQVTAIGKLFDIYNEGTGLNGILNAAKRNVEDAGATFIHIAQSKAADLDSQLADMNSELGQDVQDVLDRQANFQAEADDFNNTVSDMRNGVDMWTNTTLQGLRYLDNQVAGFNQTLPNISPPVLSALNTLVTTIESTLARSLSVNRSKALNQTLSTYMAQFNLTKVTATNTTSTVR